MSDRAPRWTVLITHSADDDIRDAVRWSVDRFGTRQARVYAETLSLAIRELRMGPGLIGIKERDEIAKGLLAIHVARHGRKGRHFVMFRVVDEQARVLEIVRLLHDSMDFPRHLPE
jgi:toxin ParE1/3/4